MDQILESPQPTNNPPEPQTTPPITPSPEPVAPVVSPPTPTPKPKSLLFPILLTFLITSTLFIGGYFGYQKFLTPTDESVPTPTPTSEKITSAPDPTTDWETYENSDFNFSIKYPQDVVIEKILNDEYNRSVSFSNKDLKFFITLRQTHPEFNLDTYYYMDSPIAESTILSNQPANVYKLPNGYCDGPGCSQPSITVVTEHNGDIYSLGFIGDDQLSEVESQILSTFKFNSDEKTLMTDEWQTIKNDRISLKYPRGWIATSKSNDLWLSDETTSNQEIIIKNQADTVRISITPGQIPYGFGGEAIFTERTKSFQIFNQPASVVEKTAENQSVFIDFDVTHNNQQYFFLIGTGYPAADESKISLSDYQQSEQIIKMILESIKEE